MITVVSALIEKDNKYLIAKRTTGDPNLIGKWEFPGGKLEPNENEFEAIEREMKEEFELTVKAISYITHNIHKYPSKTIDLKLYRCAYIKGDFYLHDHSQYAFVSLKEILDYDLAPADIPLVKKLEEYYANK